ncbi:hypothetical protein EJ04DRAFT_469761, partial [Polyplosphaeria fusca]
MSMHIPMASPMRAGSERELRKHVPRLDTSPGINSTATANGSAGTSTPSTALPSAANSVPMSAGHQRFVLTDNVAFRYLEEDPSTTVLARRQQLEGYEIYLVEQWACSRTHPTFLITSYTGDPRDTVVAGVLSVPTDESTWPPQLKLYFKALDQYHAQRKETAFGTLMVTNLSSFPSSLTVIPVPEGDMKKHRELFFVNENLKRLGCSGRSGIKLAPPSSATAAKFQQLYRTSDKISLNGAVIELVKLCQVALVMFDKLGPEYADGLLCDITERAINDWWVEFGTEYYNVEPHDGILGPTTVAALLGMLTGVRNRLSAFNAPVSKDVFDIESTKRGIAYFQKTQRINKTRRLDRHTLDRLRRATAKAASREGWGMPRALKSTVAELGGKGGEMVMDMVGAGDKAGIADVETVDIDQFIDLVQGERSKWLWYGKPRKSNTGDMFKRLPGEDASPEETHPHSTRLLKRETTFEGHGLTKRDTNTADDSKKLSDVFGIAEGAEKERDKDPSSKRTVIKRATGKLEFAIGRRSHQQKPGKEDGGRYSLHHPKSDLDAISRQQTDSSLAAPTQQEQIRSGLEPLGHGTSISSAQPMSADYEPSFSRVLTETPRDSMSTLALNNIAPTQPDKIAPVQPDDVDSSKPPTVENSIAGSIYHGIDLAEKLPVDDDHDTSILLRRTQSSDKLSSYHLAHRNNDYWPRHMSFSIAEESILTWPSLILPPTDLDADADTDAPTNIQATHSTNLLLTEEAKRLHTRLCALRALDAHWVSSRLSAISSLDRQADADTQDLEQMYFPRLETYHALREDAHEITASARHQLLEGIRDLETLGAKLEYEIQNLRSKVDDVEDGAAELERQVEGVEGSVRELERVCGVGREGVREGWVHWGVRILTGIGRR